MVLEIHVNELIKIAGGRQLDDHVFPRAGLCARRHCGKGIWCRDGHGRLFRRVQIAEPAASYFCGRGVFPGICPILAEYKSKQGEDATRVFVSYVSGLLTLALAVVTVIGMLAAPWVIMVTAPGFADTADKFALTSQLLRITFPIFC
jgi:uncharacterized protein (DUF983 family)